MTATEGMLKQQDAEWQLRGYNRTPNYWEDRWQEMAKFYSPSIAHILKEPPMLFEVAIIQAQDGKATGQFTVENIIAKDGEQAKIKALTQTKLAGDAFDLTVKVRAF